MPFSDLLGEILGAFGGGMGQANASPMGGAPMPQPRPPQAPPGQMQGPPQGGAQNPQDYYAGLSRDLPPMLGMPPIDQGGGGPQPATQAVPQQGAPMQSGPPMPQPRPPGAPQGLMQGPMALGPQGSPANLYPNPGPPVGAGGQSGAIPTPPPMGPGEGQQWPTADTMRGALGINPSQKDRISSFEASLAGGLKGISGPGKFASFSRGLGGGLQGGLNQDQTNLKNNMSVQQQWHNDMSQDFKDTQLMRQTDANVLWRQSQGTYFQARAANQDPNNPARLIAGIDRLEPQREQQVRLSMQAMNPGAAIDPDEYKKQVTAARNQAYQAQGLNPDQVQSVKERGMLVPKTFSGVPTQGYYLGDDGKPVQKTGKEKTDPSSKVQSINPFDASKMTDDQFHANVPVGSWFIPRGGGAPLYRREGPPPGWRGAQGALNSPNLDDQAAVYSANQP